jgi:1-pyrroline-4-hydroxy-2-carboxylate deaminase
MGTGLCSSTSFSGGTKKQMTMEWRGVIPAITTPFNPNFSINYEFFARHCRWVVEHGCTGVVALGSLGEGGTLTHQERTQVLRTCVKAIGGNASVIAGVASLSTTEAVSMARMAEAEGCDGLMVLPPYVYLGDWRETKAHVGAVFSATKLPCMLYNNPIAYKVDFLPSQVMELLSEYPNFRAIKESSADVRRVTALRSLAGDRLEILCGVDDAIVEAVHSGAAGWIAGLVNAFPAESVELFNLARHGDSLLAFELYRWFLPLLRMDTGPKFVQLIKLVQEAVGMGTQTVRPPRLALTGAELEEARAIIEQSMATHPSKQRPAGAGGS